MFGKTIVGGSSGFTLTKALGGISKVLSVANQAIPIYQQVKPMFQNAKGTLNVLKNVLSSDKKEKAVEEVHKKEQKTENSQIIPTKTNNNPVFFQ